MDQTESERLRAIKVAWIPLEIAIKKYPGSPQQVRLSLTNLKEAIERGRLPAIEHAGFELLDRIEAEWASAQQK